MNYLPRDTVGIRTYYLSIDRNLHELLVHRQEFALNIGPGIGIRMNYLSIDRNSHELFVHR